MAATPKSNWPWVKALLHSVYDQPDAASVHAQFDRVLDALVDKLPKVAAHLDAAELRPPKLRTSSFFPSLLERRRSVDQALFAVVMEAYLHGVCFSDAVTAAMPLSRRVDRSCARRGRCAPRRPNGRLMAPYWPLYDDQ
jgi:transposase-like protein